MISNQFPTIVYGENAEGQIVPLGALIITSGGQLVLTPVSGGSSGEVISFNGRAGAVTLLPGDVSGASGLVVSNLGSTVQKWATFVTTAIGDGTTDDTAAIQADIVALEAAGGGILQFKAGTYKVTSTINITADNVILNGVGMASQILATGDYGDVFFFGKGDNSKMFASGVTNLWIGSATTRTSGYCINAQYTYWFTVDNVRLGNSSGVVPITSDPTPIYNGLFLNGQAVCYVNQLWVYMTGEGVTVAGGSPGYYDYDGWMAHMEIVGLGSGTGIHLLSGIGGLTIADSNVFNATNGMIVDGGSFQLFLNNIFFDSCSGNGARFKTGALGTLVWSDVWAASNGSVGIVFEDNSINNQSFPASLGGAGYVIANGTADIDVGTGNTILLGPEIYVGGSITGAGTVIRGGGGDPTMGGDGSGTASALEVLSALSGATVFTNASGTSSGQFFNGTDFPNSSIGIKWLGAPPLDGDLVPEQYTTACMITAPESGWTFAKAIAGTNTVSLFYHTADGGVTWTGLF